MATKVKKEVTKKTLAEDLAAKYGLTKKDAAEAVGYVFDEIADALKKGGEANINGFGKFSVTKRAARTGLNPATGAFAEGGIAAQTRQSLTNVKNVLEAAGSGMDKVVKTVVFLKDMNDFAAMNAVYAEFFGEGGYPARSAVEVARLPKDGLVEIEAVATL